MEKELYWNQFKQSGRVEDYLHLKHWEYSNYDYLGQEQSLNGFEIWEMKQ